VVVSRYRLPTTLCLTVLAAAVAVRVARWARERRWLGATAAAAAALVLTGALHTDLIYRWAVPLVRPKGFVDQGGERTVIRDDAEPLRECFTWLRDPAMCVEKTLVVPEGLLPIQKAWVAVLYRAEQPSRCLIIVNGRPWPVDLSASSGRSGMLQVPPSAIVPGPNVIRVKTVGDSSVAVWVSDRFRFGRSRWQDTSGDWHRRYLDEESPLRRVSTHLVSGEYAIRLHVSRGQTGER
jgi:hypothetical protein